MGEPSEILVRGAREHNLREVGIALPRNRLICFTGVSGSGKSSLAFDTLYAEGQRRYIESLSPYARQFLGQRRKPDADLIAGLSPAIAIQQKTSNLNPRSTVGTITQIHDYLRVLYARIGIQHCTRCDRPITAQSREQIIARILQMPADGKLLILAPVVRGQKGEFRDLFEDMLTRGYARARVDGQVISLADGIALHRHRKHDIEVVVDRLTLEARDHARVAEAVEQALQLGAGTLLVSPLDGEQTGADVLLSSHYACTRCDQSFEPPSPQMFSFNSPAGMCQTCDGLGESFNFDADLLVPDKTRSFLDLAVEPLRTRIGRWRRHIYEGVARHVGFALDTPWQDLSRKARHALLHGTGEQHITFEWRWRGGVWRHGGTFAGVVAELVEKYRRSKSAMARRYYEKYMRQQVCPTCAGRRLQTQALHVRLAEKTLPEIEALSIAELGEFLASLPLTPTQQIIAHDALNEIRARVKFLLDVGLHYLTLGRAAPSLSGGEAQRIRLASQIGSGLTGVLYILDEPSIGLHHRDQMQLVSSLQALRDQGNTVIVVEHDEDTMRAADLIVDFGPGPGVRGGHIVASGTLGAIGKAQDSLTGAYLTGRRSIDIPTRRPVDRAPAAGGAAPPKRGAAPPSAAGLVPWLEISGARQHNLQDIDVRVPLQRFVCVTGVSGSGKSSLVRDIIREQLLRDLNGAEKTRPGAHRRITGQEHLDKIIDIDQSPIGRTPRSNPATYVKIFDLIRGLYARLPDARVRGYKPGRFSFNVPTGRAGGGRCEVCEGHGSQRVEMDFLADVWVDCPVCAGRRFNRETLQILYKGKHIADVLDMDVQEALQHFENVPQLAAMLRTLHDVGLDYMKLGQSSTTLSGGEAQRIKLARELSRSATGRTLYILDEPTTGLHFEDVRRLLEVLQGLVDRGNSMVVIEHNLDVLKTADWIIDLGPEGGAGGGRLVAAGTPENLAAAAESHTGQALRPVLGLSRAPVRRGRRQGPGRLRADRGQIEIRGARQHNLKNVSVDIARQKMTVFTGLSGSGKSSLALDTLYTEGHRRYVESLSAYARQFLGQLQKPQVDHIAGLPPAIAIDQKAASHSPRSTVGTVTEIHDYLRVLYARLGLPHCPACDRPIGARSSEEIVNEILREPPGTRALLLAPLDPAGQEKYSQLLGRLRAGGYARVRLDGQIRELSEDIPISDRSRHRLDVVVDRVTLGPEQRSRITDSVEQALALSGGAVVLARPEQDGRAAGEMRFSQHFACAHCGQSYEELTPHHFSFNSRLGWCASCEGLGTQLGAPLEGLILRPDRPVTNGAIAGWSDLHDRPLLMRIVEAVAGRIGFALNTPWRELKPEQQHHMLHGLPAGEWLAVRASDGGNATFRVQWKGFFPAIDQAARASWQFRLQLKEMVTELPCRACAGSRLNPLARHVRLGSTGQALTLHELSGLPLDKALEFLDRLKLDGRGRKIAGEVLRAATGRLQFLVDLGLEYMTLQRASPTLSGGEAQRIRLAAQLGSGLTGVLYVLDEPTIGLHSRDTGRLIKALQRLRDAGNTLCVVEHDREVMASADAVLDLGPEAGHGGGEVVAHKSPSALRHDRHSLTGRFLSGKAYISVPSDRRPVNTRQPAEWIHVRGAWHHNLKNVDASFPLGRFIAVTGVSGSGKSSLVLDVLGRGLAAQWGRGGGTPGGHAEIEGAHLISQLAQVDQSPLGHTPSSNPATYTGIFDVIRELYARLPEARVRGYSPARFSFNRPGGRCETCQGLGQVCIEMHFLPDVWVGCEECGGRRYNAQTLGVTYRGKSIADVLRLPTSQAAELFCNVPKLQAMLQMLVDVGLGYVQLGQSATTLSGGEAQRVKLAAELGKLSAGGTVYLLDEPTTGLHFEDVRKLLDVLHRLCDLGNTVICIEHNLDLIKTADWIIDLGPEAGDAGGEIVASGTPEHVARHRRSRLAPYLSSVLKAGPVAARTVFDPREAARRQALIAGRLNVAKMDGGAARLPWEVDGRSWHTKQCLAANGLRPRWDAQALTWMVDFMERLPGLAPSDWKHRSRIEIKAHDSRNDWFCHILTRGEWLLECTFRVPRRTFDIKTLARGLELKTLDERTDLPVYGQWCRVKRRVRRDSEDVRIYVHDLQEIKTPAFQGFLQAAARAHLQGIGAKAAGDGAGKPWRVDGRRWHMTQSAIPTLRRKQWQPAALAELIGRAQRAIPSLEFDWNHKTMVALNHPQLEKPLGKIGTSHHAWLSVEIGSGRNCLTPARIEGLGRSPRIIRGSERDRVTFRVRESTDVDGQRLTHILRQAAESLLASTVAGGGDS
jgi:excinuclease ABC subunit A